MDFDDLHNEKNIAVGLSGGGDSMALTHMLCLWAQQQTKNIHAITIDHGLRKESAAESEHVKNLVQNWPHLTHVTLKCRWDTKPQSAVMEQARNARYNLMRDYCLENNIQFLCLAHHGDDQIETFFHRLTKGSGLDGLASMTKCSKRDHITLYRPLLNRSHDDLIAYCESHGLEWIEDPSNQNDAYTRPRLRKMLNDEGFDTYRFSKTCERLNRARAALDWMRDQAIASCVCHAFETINFQSFKTYPADIQIRVLQHCLTHVGDTTHNHPPKLERVEDILATIMPSKSATLHGCLITLSKDGKTLEIKGTDR